MDLPEGVRTFFLLKAANLTDESEQLAGATANLTYKDKCDKVMKISGDPGVLTEKDSVPEVKVLYGFSKKGKDTRNQ